MNLRVVGYHRQYRQAVLDLSRRAWQPVFVELRVAVPAYVYRAFYPDGWWERQRQDIAALLDSEHDGVSVALVDDVVVVGWVGIRLHPEDSMGEIYILAVDPDHQRKGVARALMAAAHEQMRAAGMTIAMVETGGDPGHQPSRATYVAAGYERWPVARYFRKLTE